ncbi:MAG: purine-nucleoside phosphorylase [Prevotellaceae bacterium]|jgi:purine-nucleoside phosphorylase|nr:purine-nucleoside phosphorylase [Prevotellaceae bacterium]
MYEKIKKTADFIRTKTSLQPETGIILGSGLGGLATKIAESQTFEYADIPGFPVSTVEGHAGRLIFGKLNSERVVAMQGRFHYYEGYSMEQITFPVRVMKELGIKRLFVSNASGGLNPRYEVGTLMIISDHINLLPNPLIGRNDDRLGIRFPDMSHAYDPELIDLAFEVAKQHSIAIEKGVYVGTAGPTFETPAECKYFRLMGGDAIGMSTVPEVIVARHAGLPVFGISVVTNVCMEGEIVEASHEDVQREGAKAEIKMMTIISGMLENKKI